MGTVNYSAEKIPSSKIKTMLQNEWDDRVGGEIPEPTFLEVISEEQMVNLYNEGDAVVIRPDTRGETERLRDSWHYKDTDCIIGLELYTQTSRQRLYDIKQEIRRIVHNNRHDENTTGFQVLLYESFIERSDLEQNLYSGEIKLRLSSVGEEIDE